MSNASSAESRNQVSAQTVKIAAPKILTSEFGIAGTAPLVMNKFSSKARQIIMDTQAAGTQAKSKKVRVAKDFDQVCDNAVHYSTDGWVGIPASAFRAAMISACRLVGFKMTLAKLSVFIKADGFDRDDGTPLVRLLADDYERVDHPVRNATGVVDIRSRPMWRSWRAVVTISWDGDQFSLQDVANLLMRVGSQVGLLEGRPDSRASAGMGWGTFELEAAP